MSKYYFTINTTDLWYINVGDTVVYWLVRWTSDQAVWVRSLAWAIALCSWARHLTLTVPLSSQEYTCKWYRRQNSGGNLRWTSMLHPIQGSSNTPSRLHVKETGISSSSVGQFGPSVALPVVWA